MSNTITAERLRELLAYDPLTGLFVWKVIRAPKYKPGDVAGTPHKDGYVHITVDGSKYLAHRLAFLAVTGSMPPQEVDHINGIRNDNRWMNLRATSHQENMQNRRGARRDNTSGYQGVKLTDNGRWQARAFVNGKHVHLGTFEDREIAAKIASEYRAQHYKGFCGTESRHG